MSAPLRFAFGAAAFLLMAGQADAHAHLKSSVPEADATVLHAPDEVVITFTEKLETKLSDLSVKNGAGQRVDKGDTHTPANTDGKTIAVTLGAVPAGTYTVSWTATSVDTHRTNGTFTFVVKR